MLRMTGELRMTSALRMREGLCDEGVEGADSDEWLLGAEAESFGC